MHGDGIMALKVIALTGPKGSGKDTVALLVKEMYPHLKVKSVAFADPIKSVIQHLFALDPTSVDQYDLFKRDTVSHNLPGYGLYRVPGRHIVREIGMLMRNYDSEQFNEYVRKQLTSAAEEGYDIGIVTDLRFDNEYLMLKSMGANIIKILRPSYRYDGHITERGFDDHLVSQLLMNDGDMNHLRIRVKIVIDKILQE